MSGYRGDGYGQYGNVGDDHYRFGDENEGGRAPSHGAATGNLLGRAEHDAAAFFGRGGEGQDPRARRAADDWNHRFGREGYEGSYAQDDGYRQYRERHLAELDRDYDDWCREREQQFHSDFDDWRNKRRIVTNQPGNAQAIDGDREADRLTSDEGRAAATSTRRAKR